jgi:hypothetical protein
MRRDNNEVRAGIDKIFHRVLPLIMDTCQANRRVWTLSDNLSNKQISQLEKHRASNWPIGHYATKTTGLTFIHRRFGRSSSKSLLQNDKVYSKSCTQESGCFGQLSLPDLRLAVIMRTPNNSHLVDQVPSCAQ